MKKIAITGGIGSGKSTICALIKEQGYPVFSCDEIYNDIITMPLYIEKISCTFPSAVKNGQIDRQTLRNIIFHDDSMRERLNAIAHPLIMERLQEKMHSCCSPLIFAEVPLLFEGGYENLFDYIIIVKRDMDMRMDAVAIRDGVSLEEVKLRIKAQIDYEGETVQNVIKNRRATILQNNTDINNLKKEIICLLQQLS